MTEMSDRHATHGRATGAAGPPTADGVTPAGPVRASAYVCEAVSCLSARSHDILTGLGAQVGERRA